MSLLHKMPWMELFVELNVFFAEEKQFMKKRELESRLTYGISKGYP